ncbi:hypothetical protein SAMN05421765_0485 [Kaistella antarctica]|uniref:Molybdenum ABC transporter permease n=1 Tax=Kaistella antarctica TaxID=266748 RepID=A0A3S4W5G7_9FLAO|nr:hypothetical protein HY04_06395 [Kaistella antarctica]SEV83103.1 hypothetical protein SAMN05421765_0485 [Kaistella antarctica]VEI00739.1 Uncharacterised protein [Kaistella antarctica]
MDFLYAGVLLFFGIYLLLFLRIKRNSLKETSKFRIPSPDDLGELFQMYLILTILVGFIIYFIFR